MIHNQNFPFDGEDREIIHVNPRNSAAKKMGPKIVLLSLFFASLMFGAKYIYDLGRGSKDFAQAPLMIAGNEPFKKTPEDPGGMKIPYIDKEIYKNLNPAFIDQHEDISTMPEAEKPMETDVMASLIENNFDDGFDDEDSNPSSIKIPAKPSNKPQRFKLSGDGQLAKASGSTPERTANSKKVDVTKILAKQNESEIWIQLGTFPNEQEATKAWQSVREKNGDILGGNQIKITKSDLGDKGVFYRLQSGPFESEASARDICKAMNEREQNCFFVKQNPKS